jgi:hypothetical protein
LLPSLRRLSGYGLIRASGFSFKVLTLAGFHLAAFTLLHIAQRKMELNDCCSPDLSNDRRQNDFYVSLRPALGRCLSFIQGLRSKLLCPSFDLCNSWIWWS